MGKIHEKVRLTNSTDEVLHRRGKLAAADVHCMEADAIVDTGAVRSVIPIHVAERLGLQITGHIVVRYAEGRSETVGVTEPVIFECQHRNSVEEALILADSVLIGQTVLEKPDLLADCANRRLMPHPDRPHRSA